MKRDLVGSAGENENDGWGLWRWVVERAVK